MELLFMGGIGAMELLVLIVFLLIPSVLWVWALINALKSDFNDSATKLTWVLVIIFLPLLGAILYLTIGRKQRITVR